MTSVGHRTHLIGFILLAILTLIFSSVIADPSIACITLAAYGIFILPGVLAFLWSGTPGWHSLIYGSPLGMALTSLAVLVCVAYGGWNETRIALTYVAMVVLIYIVSRGVAPKIKAALPLGETDHPSGSPPPPSTFVYVLVGAYMALAFIPLARAGALTEHGYAFTGLFGHDYILRSADAVALSNAAPLDNYFFNGVKTENYYILWYMLPATTYRFLRQHGNMRAIVGTICLANIPFFCLILYDVLMKYSLIQKNAHAATETRQTRRIAILFSFLFFCYSYHWVFVLGKLLSDRMGPDALRQLFASMSFVSQSWFRDMIFEPHSVLALMFAMLFMILLTNSPSPVRGFVNGILLAALALTDSSIFMIVGSAYAIWWLIAVFTWEQKGSWVADAAATVATGAAVFLLMFGCQVIGIPEYSNRMVFSPYVWVISTLPVFLLLNLGAHPLAAAMQPGRGSAKKIEGILTLLVLASLFFMLFVTETLEGNVILRKSLKVIRLPIYAMAVKYLLDAWGSRTFRLLTICLVISFPTVLTDTFFMSDVMDGRITTYVPKDYMEAALWIKANTPPDAVVQSAIDQPGYFGYSLTICFAERKAALGDWKMAFQRYPNRTAIDERVRAIRRLFLTDDAGERRRLAEELRIDYLLIGPTENNIYPGASRRYTFDNKHFRKVFSAGSVEIFRVV